MADLSPKGRRGQSGRQVVRDPEGARKALLSSAIRLFERNGYAATSVQSIIDGANLTKGAFYHHFKSKEDLLFHVHDRFIDHQLHRAREVVADTELPADEKLRRLIVEALLEPMAMYKPEITVFLQERRFLSGETFVEIKEKREAFERCFVDVVETGMQEGVFREVGLPHIVAFGIIGMGAWTHVWLDAESPASPTEIGRVYAEIVVNGLR
ncbi:TetR/AcrR family transcriptional regulator [Spongiactinospora sp. TRM90649]|uniref:TetR/AcrR family transcriptional regulator n=1 Tax=Spongiactinospora sp. TRM90649 TaxID=3031114 RepID=UPI0023F8893B|nr:TetR/AcrR family transcriptional regulator [Spongiactinospora sp. TRM90649]MDF5751211.1 TetR/AcrR family transcriptional regulator [Spongiactinospora sp. TRM90649]